VAEKRSADFALAYRWWVSIAFDCYDKV